MPTPSNNDLYAMIRSNFQRFNPDTASWEAAIQCAVQRAPDIYPNI